MWYHNPRVGVGMIACDYKVRNHVDFSKLFLATNMAIYTAFDETVDISALLGMIISIDTFPQNVRNPRVAVGMIACRFQRIACIYLL
jgi:hypothetical protein